MYSTDPTVNSVARADVGSLPLSGSAAAYWTLRVGAAACFIGHGAFGFITKAEWLPYFAVVGLPESLAWRLMPVIGAVDVMMGMAVLFAPRGLPMVYMTAWALWTALLRPLSGESVFEMVERAGNFGVPLALLFLTVGTISARGLLSLRAAPVSGERVELRVKLVLQWTTVLLLFGHGALGVFVVKAGLTAHYAAIGLPPGATGVIGWLEIGLAALVALRPMPGLLLVVVAWKLATESLFVVAGAPIWEFVERAGSYAAPLALWCLSGPRTMFWPDGRR
jgi:hypothetical protein